jgi:hypothetical protein
VCVFLNLSTGKLDGSVEREEEENSLPAAKRRRTDRWTDEKSPLESNSFALRGI